MPLYAPFGNAIFAETVFGLPPGKSTYTELTVQPPIGAAGQPSEYAYSGLQIDWQPAPVGQFTGQVLMRSSYGIPISIYDGTTLVSQLPQATPQSYTSQYLDTGLKSGQFYYYALFVYSIALQSWVLSGSAQGLCLTDWGFGSTFQTWMPDWYLEQDSTLATTAVPEGPLVRFLELLGLETDWVRSEIESLILLSNVDLISGALLPYLGANYGMTYEPVLGMTRSRVLVKNAVYLYKNKGTTAGIAAAASGYSGFGAEVTVGKNLEIQLDDSAFDRSAGHWVANNGASFISAVAAASVNVGTPPHTLYDAVVADTQIGGYLPNNNVNVAEITAGYASGASTWSSISPLTSPAPRSSASMAYDTSTTTAYLFGGQSSSSLLADTWAFSGTTWSNVTPAIPVIPTPIEVACAALDPNGNVILFGGINASTISNTTWSWNGTAWTQLSPATSPPQRYGACMAFDVASNTTILFGGYDGSVYLNDTWSWNGTTWTQIFPVTSPAVRAFFMMAYDGSTGHATSGQIILFAGQNASGVSLVDTWAWNGSNWALLSPATSPPARIVGSMAYYPTGFNGVYLFGGSYGATYLNDTWYWNGTTWTQITPATSPSGRYYSGMAYDVSEGALVVFGGINGTGVLNDTWTWNGSNWTQQLPAASPGARLGHIVVYQPSATDVVVATGSAGGASLFSDTWTWNGTTWTENVSPSITARYGAAMAYDTSSTKVVLFGGNINGVVGNDTWNWNGSSWTLLAPATSPAVRFYAQMSYDASTGHTTSSSVVLFGGYNDTTALSDTWYWNGTTWTQLTPVTTPAARYQGAMAYDGNAVHSTYQQVLMFGGNGNSGILGDTWTWTGSNWVALSPVTSPPARFGASMVYHTGLGEIILTGGYSSSGFAYSDTWAWNGTTWTQLSPLTAISPGRVAAAACYDTASSALVLFGGADSRGTLGDTWLYSAAAIPSLFSITTCPAGTAQNLGIPCVVGQTWVASAYFRAYSQATPVTKAFKMQIDWYGTNGVLISSSQGAAVTDSTSVWTRAYCAATAPAGALTFGRTVVSTATLSGDLHFMDAEQVEINTQGTPGPTTWDPPRDIKVNLFPIRQNLVPNPVGLGASYGWTIAHGTFAASSTQAILWPATTTSGFILTATSTTAINFSTINLPVNPGVAYTFSMYSRPVVGANARDFQVVVQWYTSTGGFISQQASGLFVEVAGTFVQASLTNQTAPATAATAIVQLVVLSPSGSGEQHYVSAAMLEPEGYLRPYFDANFSPATDYVFEGSPNLSVSDYYPNLISALTRLSTALPEFVPIGSTFSLVTGSAALANSNLVG